MMPDRNTSLRSIMPMEEIRRCFDREITFSEYEFADIGRIAELKPYALSGLAMSVRNRLKQSDLSEKSSLPLDSRSKSDRSGNSITGTDIEGAEIIRDVYYATAAVDDPLLRDLRVAEIFAALVKPNSLYIADFDFSMMPRCKTVSGSLFPEQWYSGILNKMIDKAVNFGVSQGCSHILMNAKRSQYIEIFLKRGFLLEDPKTESHIIRLGLGIPMVRTL